MMKNSPYVSLVIVFLCLLGWTVHAQLQTNGPARPAWEYKSMVLVIQVGTAGTRNIFYEDGKSASGTPVTRMPELGAQGWELVSVAGTSSQGSTIDSSTYVYWLKRPR